MKSGSIIEKIYYAFSYNILLLVFVLTAQQFTLLCFFQFQYISETSLLGIISTVLAILVLIYYFGFMAYYVNTVLTGEIFKNQTLSQKYAVFSAIFKSHTVIYRMFPIAYMLKKILTSAILVYAYQSSDWQTILSALVQFGYWVYIFLYNPIKKEYRPLKVLLTIIESELLLLNILFSIIVIQSNKNSLAAEIELSKWSLYLLAMIQMTYTVFGVGLAV